MPSGARPRRHDVNADRHEHFPPIGADGNEVALARISTVAVGALVRTAPFVGVKRADAESTT